MQFGVRGHDVTSARTPEELGRALEELGVPSVQLALAKSFPDLPSGAADVTDQMGERIRAVLAAHGVHVAVLGCYFNMIDPDRAAREAGFETFAAYLAHARAFGAPVVASETGSVDPTFAYTEDNFTPEAFDAAAQMVARLCAVAERYDVTVGVEPGVNHPIHDIDTIARLIERVPSPQLGIILDPTALVTPEIAPQQVELARAVIDQFGARICACHLVDYRLVDGCIERCNVGEGQAPVEELVQLFHERLPHVCVISEFTEDAAIARVVDLMKRVG